MKKFVWNTLYIISMIIVIFIIFIIFSLSLYDSFATLPVFIKSKFINTGIIIFSLLFFYGAYKINIAKATSIWLLTFVILIPITIVVMPMYIFVPPLSIAADKIIGNGEYLPDFKIMISSMIDYYKQYNDYLSFNHISVLFSEMWVLLLSFGIFFYGNYLTIRSTKKEVQSINEKL